MVEINREECTVFIGGFQVIKPHPKRRVRKRRFARFMRTTRILSKWANGRHTRWEEIARMNAFAEMAETKP